MTDISVKGATLGLGLEIPVPIGLLDHIDHLLLAIETVYVEIGGVEQRGHRMTIERNLLLARP